MAIEKIFDESVFHGSPIAKNMTQFDLLLELLYIYQLNFIVTLTNEYLQRNILPETIIWYMIKLLGVLILTTGYELSPWSDMWSSRSQYKYAKPHVIGKLGFIKTKF